MCGWTDGRLTLRTITIDGDVAEWAGILADPDNNACDGTDSSDRDYPIQSTGRNLARIAWTWNATSFFMYTQRVGQANNAENFIYYADTSNDGNMQTGEPVIVAAWQGSNQIVKMDLYTYNAVAPGGDPLVGGTGYADGYHLPGILTQVRALTDGHGDTTGTQMEWAAAWSDLGVTSGQAIQWHVSSTNSNPGGNSLPSQIDDNMGGCGGGCSGSIQFADLTLSAGTSVQTLSTVYLPHALTNTGNGSDRFDLTAASGGGWTPASVVFYRDIGVIGTYEPVTDLPLADTDADGTVDSGNMTSGQVLHFFVAVTPPGPPTAGDATVTTTARSNFAGKCGGGTPPSRSAADQVHILAADLQMTKTDGVASAVPGTSLTYTIRVTNAGPDTATGAAVADTFNPSWFNVPGISWNCAITTGTGSCQAASGAGNIATSVNLNSGAVATFTVTAPILAAATGTITNTATVTTPADRVDPAPGNNSATDADTALAPSCDMQATKTDGLVSAVPGTSLTYTITVTNAGPSSAVAAPVTDPLNAAFFNVAGASWTCSITAGSGACGAASGSGALSTTVGLGPAATATYTITVPILSSATGTISNTVTAGTPPGASDPIPANNSATDGDTVLQPTGDLSITKTDGVTSYTPGSTVTYTIVVGNTGPSDVTGATVTDAVLALPQVAGVSWTCAAAGGATCTAGPATGNVSDIINLPVGGTATYTLVVTLRPGSTGNLLNTAGIAAPAGTIDPAGGNNSATDTDAEARISDLSISKADGVASYTPGSGVTYTIIVGNSGPSDVTGATVTDAVLGLPQVASASWTCAATGGAACTAGPVTGSISDTVNVPVGGTVTYTLVVTLRPGATGNLVNTATVTVPGGTTDPGAANNTATDTDTPAGVADLAITKTDGAATYLPGGSLTYTITVTNAGPSDAVGAAVPDTFDATRLTNINWTCAASAGSACTAASGSGNISGAATILAGGTLTYSITANVLPGATGNLVNTATVTVPGGTTDPAAANNTATDTDTPAGVADLAITKTDGAATYLPGGSLTYTITVTNAGPSDAVGASVADTFDATRLTNIAWTCAASAGSACTAASGSGNISGAATVLAGGTLTYTITANVLPGATGNLVNTATVTVPGGTTDPAAANNTATDTDTPAGVADLAITKTDGSATYLPGGSLTYTITVTNAGPSDAVGAAVADTFDATRLTNIDWTCAASAGSACTAASGSGNISGAATILAGGTLTYSITANVLPGATGNLVNTATVTAPGGTTDPAAANNTATDTDTPAGVADLAITKTDGAATYLPGGSVTYTITVTNAGPSDAVGAAVADTFDATRLTNIAWTCAASAGSACTAASGSGEHLRHRHGPRRRHAHLHDHREHPAGRHGEPRQHRDRHRPGRLLRPRPPPITPPPTPTRRPASPISPSPRPTGRPRTSPADRSPTPSPSQTRGRATRSAPPCRTPSMRRG